MCMYIYTHTNTFCTDTHTHIYIYIYIERESDRGVKIREKMGSCPPAMKATSNGVFGGESPLEFALPLVILQICLVLFLTRLLSFLLRPFRQPRVVAEILSGILLGPSALGRIAAYKVAVFPARSITVLETIANIGLIFFLFLTGLEIDLPSLRRTGKISSAIAAVGMILPFAIGVASSLAFPEYSSGGDGGNRVAFVVFMGVAVSITAFGVLARILAELKLLTTDLGRIAMSAAALNDVAAWVVLALAVALAGDKSSPFVPVWVLLSGFAFVIACVLIVPPFFSFVSRRCEEGQSVDETYVCGALAVVLIAGFTTDAIGVHAIFGAFVIGVLFPKGYFADAIVEKMEDIVTGLLLPLYFVLSGLKTDITTIRGLESWGRLLLAIATACIGKVVGTVGVSLLCKLPFGESLALGVLMNTKGLTELIVLNIGKDRKVLGDQTFAIMVLMAIFTTFITTPIVLAFYKPARTTQTQESDVSGSACERKMERDDGVKTQLRLMLCLHGTRDINPMINIIEASRGTEVKSRGLCVYAMHITELSERPSSIRMVHKARRNGFLSWNKTSGSNSDTVAIAFEAFGRLSRVSVRSVTAISPLSTIHEDICSSAARKRVAMVILPFSKHWKPLEKAFEMVRPEFQTINMRVLENSPCSVGILADRGLGIDSPATASKFSSSIAVLFFGGCDDREALAYGLRMVEHPGVSLTVVTITGDFRLENSRIDILEEQETMSRSQSDSQVIAGVDKMAMTGTKSVKLVKKSVKSSDEAVEIFRESCRSVDIVFVGRSPESSVVSSLPVKKMECPELGPVGNLMLSNEISNSVSVLAVQQFTGKASSGGQAAVGSARITVAETP
ncbi:PREDICTED: cation/H(+) antiporter 16 [Tarenaya hassleriana]|uniref:cation/H(+) antiporter 16 n=1 Tax=Tarenaya hassleriana TaxID=28532 RepID=UPI00053C88B8|nr:PREDICTED: cation/H(+) antiporter 16 [Tarenaya hassleriana]